MISAPPHPHSNKLLYLFQLALCQMFVMYRASVCSLSVTLCFLIDARREEQWLMRKLGELPDERAPVSDTGAPPLFC